MHDPLPIVNAGALFDRLDEIDEKLDRLCLVVAELLEDFGPLLQRAQDRYGKKRKFQKG